MANRTVFVGADKTPSLIHAECNLPIISEGQVLAKIRLATICVSDLHTIAGKRNEVIPSVLGHEAVAEVVENRRDDCDLIPGDRITFSIINSCDACSRCLKGVPQKCERLKKIGHMPIDHCGGYTGCYSSHIILEKGTAIFRIPDGLPDRIVAPINCALATMVNAVSCIPHTCEKEKASFQTVLIQGAGMLGIYGSALLHTRGFKKVFCSDPDRERVLLASRFGAAPCNPGWTRDLPSENSVDVVIEACGLSSVVQAGLRYLRPGGIYIFIGMVHPNTPLDITGEQIIRKCLTIKGVHNYAPEHLKEAVEFIDETKDLYPYESLISPHYLLSDLPTAVHLARTQKFHRVCVKPTTY